MLLLANARDAGDSEDIARVRSQCLLEKSAGIFIVISWKIQQKNRRRRRRERGKWQMYRAREIIARARISEFYEARKR